MRLPRVYLITGYARAGKDTLASALAEALNCEVHAFADKLKDAVNKYFTALGIERVNVHETADKIRFRELLVAAGRAARSVDCNVFADHVALDCHLALMRGRSAVVSDWRYLNEHERIVAKVGRDRVVTIHIDRVGIGPANSEEADTIDTILESLQIDDGRCFQSGDTAGIADWARALAAEHSPHVPAA